MGIVRCCVPGCEDKVSSRHRFPHPRTAGGRFKVWLDILQNPLLDKMPFEEIYNKKRVCKRHFADTCFSEGRRSLNYDSVPSKYIPGGEPTLTVVQRSSMLTDLQPSRAYEEFPIAGGSGTAVAPVCSVGSVAAEPLETEFDEQHESIHTSDYSRDVLLETMLSTPSKTVQVCSVASGTAKTLEMEFDVQHESIHTSDYSRNILLETMFSTPSKTVQVYTAVDATSAVNISESPAILDNPEASPSETLDPVLLEFNTPRKTATVKVYTAVDATSAVNISESPAILDNPEASPSETLDPVLLEFNTPRKTATVKVYTAVDATSAVNISESPAILDNPGASPSETLDPVLLEFNTPRKTATVKDLGKNLLREVDVPRQVNLTPKARYLYKQASTLKKKMYQCRRKCISLRSRLSMADDFANSRTMENIEKQLSPIVFQFFSSQLRLASKKPKGRRFSLPDKVLALSLFKQSGKAYRLLSKIFVLPSRKTLMNLLKRIPISTGINDVLINHLKNCASSLKPEDRFCSLLFDEMSLQPHLDYEEANDMIVGFEDFGEQDRTIQFADHALVFMLRGIRKKWKQPIMYTFCKSSTQSFKLVNLIKTIVGAVQKTPLKIVLTVCDQGATNRSAITKLIENSRAECLRKEQEYKSDGFFINGEEIIPLYDAPHLIKLIRNHMLTKDLRFTKDGKTQTGKWQHVVELYNMDKGEGEMRALPKLTARHVLPDKIKKMKVSYCTQVFSQRVATTMNMLAKRDGSATSNRLDTEAIETAQLLLFLDKLLDSVNGNCHINGKDKPLRCGLRSNSVHFKFWDEAVRVLESMKFVDRQDGTVSRPITLTNWVRTIKGIRTLWKVLSAKGFTYLLIRNLNQDPLENHFGKLRSLGCRNNSPNCVQFAGSFKSLLLNNFVSSHSVGANCEDDDATPLFANIQELFKNIPDTSEGEDEEEDEVYDLPQAPEHHPSLSIPCTSSTDLHEETATFVTGFLANRLDRQIYNECSCCKGEVYASDIIQTHSLITAREYNVTERRSLKYPSINLIICFNAIKRQIHNTLPNVCNQVGVCKILTEKIDKGYFDFLTCDDHRNLIISSFIKQSLILLIHNWCKTVNRRLLGLDLRVAEYTDKINLAAIDYYKRHQSYKAKTQHVK